VLIDFNVTDEGIDEERPLLAPPHAARSAALKHAPASLYDCFIFTPTPGAEYAPAATYSEAIAFEA
jgi:hypothetical protein